MRVIITGGGTGGHVYPAVSLAEELLRREAAAKILFIGTKRGLENSILPKHGFQLKRICVGGLIGKAPVNTVISLLKLPVGFFQSFWILIIFRPDIVIGVGGYVTGPVVLSAFILRIPIVIQEQNFFPGMTNKILGRLADKIAVSFEETEKYFSRKKVVHTGNPIRREILEELKTDHPKDQGSGFTIFIFGGSQGARGINRAMIEGLDHLNEFKDFLKIIHQTGKGDEEWVREEYKRKGFWAEVQSFIYDIVRKYKEADLVICRAGATTISELTAAGKPAILIPFPYAANNHQEINAKRLKVAGAAEMILEKDLSGEVLSKKILDLMKQRERLTDMGKRSREMGVTDAAERIIDVCYSIIKRDKSGSIHA